MAHLVSFTTDRFDVTLETPNSINPIAGQSVLLWLGQELRRAGYRVHEPDTEDWGWYTTVEGGGAVYLLGAGADASTTQPAVDWVVQLHKRRSLADRLRGRNRLAADDPVFALIERLIRADPRITQVTVDKHG